MATTVPPASERFYRAVDAPDLAQGARRPHPRWRGAQGVLHRVQDICPYPRRLPQRGPSERSTASASRVARSSARRCGCADSIVGVDAQRLVRLFFVEGEPV